MTAAGRILVLNAGSSTLKWSLADAGTGETVAEGVVVWGPMDAAARAAALRDAIERAGGADAVGHRVVHGGARFREAVRVTPEVRAALAALVPLDPLHQPAALAGIDAVGAALPDVPQVAVFDTAFHATLPEEAVHYALPWEWTERFGLRRYGFHGLSVAWSVRRATELLGRLPPRLVVCHLGSGSSVTAVRDGRSVDTTMGLTPLEGVVMATRAGDLDPGLLLHLLTGCGLTPAEVTEGLTKRAGLLGVSGVSTSLSEVQAAADAGNARARIAAGVWRRALVRSVGAAAAVLGGVDAVVFTGGIGEHVPRARAEGFAALAFAGAVLDAEANARSSADGDVATASSTVRALVVRAREDRVVAAEVRRVLGGA